MSIELPSLSTGLLSVSLALEPWPFPEPALFLEHRLQDGFLLIAGHPDGRIEASLRNLKDGEDGFLCGVISPPVELRDHVFVILTVQWQDGQIRILQINNEEVYPNCKVERIFLIGTSISMDLKSFEDQNEKTRKERQGLIERQRIRPQRKEGGKDYLIASLAGEAEQLEDLLHLILSGREAHTAGLAARLRLLIADSPTGLLQLCASFQNLPLIVYTSRQPDIAPPWDDSIAILGSASYEATDFFCTPVDLDLWLTFPAIKIGDRLYNHHQLIKDFGDTIGAHRDSGITASAQALQPFRSANGDKYGAIQKYLVEIGQTILLLSRSVLFATKSL